MREASAVFEQMDSSETPGNRASVDLCEVKVQQRFGSGHHAPHLSGTGTRQKDGARRSLATVGREHPQQSRALVRSLQPGLALTYPLASG